MAAKEKAARCAGYVWLLVTASVALVVLVVHCGLDFAGPLLLRNRLREEGPKRPPYNQYAKAARWVVAKGSFGVLATSGAVSNRGIGDDDVVVPFSNVASFSDDSTGTPFLYLTSLDGSAQDLESTPFASLTISEAFFGSCQHDPEDPTCWRVSLIGRVIPAKDPARAKELIFSKHPEARDWPSEHGFKPYEMDIKRVFLLDFYGGAHKIDLTRYHSIRLETQLDII